MYKGPKDKDNGGGRIDCRRWGVGRAGEINGGKMRATIIDNNKKNFNNKKSKQIVIHEGLPKPIGKYLQKT